MTKGEKVTGFQEVDGKVLYFDAEGKQVLGRFVTVDNYTYYLDPKTGEKYTNRSVLIDGKLYTSQRRTCREVSLDEPRRKVLVFFVGEC